MRVLLIMTILGIAVHAQSQCFYPDLENPEDLENIKVEKLNGDSLCTVFAIWVKKSVRPHYHAHHSETVVVLEGSGRMTLGDESFELKAGNTLFIPKGTSHSVEVSSETPLKVISVQAPLFEGLDRIFVDD